MKVSPVVNVPQETFVEVPLGVNEECNTLLVKRFPANDDEGSCSRAGFMSGDPGVLSAQVTDI